MTTLAVSTPPTFRYESELVAVVQRFLAGAVFSSPSRESVEVFTEVPARLGVPDVSAVRYRWDMIRDRVSNGVQPLTSEPSVRAMLLLRRRRLDTAGLAEALRMSKDHVRRAVVADLRDRGWLADASAGALLELRRSARPAGVRVVTVEAKLRDWQSAVGQARRQRYSADDAYVALDGRAAERIAEDVPAIARQGIGVIAVDPASSSMRVVRRPSTRLRSESNIVGRTLIAERGLDLLSCGQRSGEVYPVFGWTLPEH
ncbi:hypothetical protein [Curtobacterium poinsettiae]|uniref:hypothetical protein n=1 Tax=Curtobacterium poinsettiae TaxID=159612 RepID=UPI002360C146|nr:hypothetical protein [Curtobacterium flaccumfaciens]MDD1386823.1 hypothetical protein [Curtobacterium flaccumfaciens pv. poinsettiae]